jgi:Fe-S-cluster-containing dehydrogenase component
VLVDLTVCIGCRRCEWACAEGNELPHGSLDSYDDTSVFEERRYPTSKRLTVVNQAPATHDDGSPVHFKSQCMHCEHPACVSACIVGALRKDPGGPVTYDASKCIGCRYCIVACPFQMPAYEYENALTPEVRKCTLCKERTKDGGVPACVSVCPVEALTYGSREELLALAHERIRKHPDRYVNHVYGEHEAGGTSWLYLSDRPFQELGFPTLGPVSPAEVTETIQHGIFKGFAAPLLLGGLLAAMSKLSRGSREH